MAEPVMDSGRPADQPAEEQHDAAVDAGAEPVLACAPPPPSVSMGTEVDPIELPVAALPAVAEVDFQRPSFFRISGVTPGTKYIARLDDDKQLGMLVFGEDSSFTRSVCNYGPASPDTPRCVVTPAGSDIYVAVTTQRQHESFGLELEVGFDSEGSPAAPIHLAASELPYAGQADAMARSYYEITGLTPGQGYAVSARHGGEPKSLFVYTDASFSMEVDSEMYFDFGRPIAVAAPRGTSLFVDVSGYPFGTDFVLDIAPVEEVSEGTASAPHPIAFDALPFTGHVGWAYGGSASGYTSALLNFFRPRPGNRTSYYAVTDLAPGAYVVKLTADETTRLLVYGDDSSFFGATRSVLPTFSAPAECITRIAGTTLYLEVLNEGGGGGPIVIDVEAAPYTSEGSGSGPLQLALDSLPHRGQVEYRTDSYYEVTGLTPGQRYVATLTDSSAQVDLLNCGDVSRCELTPEQSSLQLTVTASEGEHSRVGAAFTLNLVPSPYEYEGSQSAPAEVPCWSAPYHAEVSGTGFYTITGLRSGVAYLVSAAPSEAEISLTVSIPGQQGSACSASSRAGETARCVAVPSATKLYVRIEAHGGTALELRVNEVASASEGALDAPTTLALGSLPYRGSVGSLAPSYYEITGLDPARSYFAILSIFEEPTALALGSIEPPFPSLDWEDPRAWFGSPQRIAFSGTDRMTLTVGAATGRFGTRLMLDVVPTPQQSEGDATAPVILHVADPAYLGQVDGSRPSWYRISGLTPGLAYVQTLSNATAYTTTIGVSGCFVASSVTSDFQVATGQAQAGTYSLDVVPSSPQSEGTTAAPIPVAVDELPRSVASDCAGPSYYAISGLTPGTAYLVTLSSATNENVLLAVYDSDATFVAQSCAAQARERCEIVATAAMLYVTVGAHDGELLDIVQVTYASEGSEEAPLPIDLAELPHAGGVRRDSFSYYSITGLSPGTTYEIVAEDHEGPVRVSVGETATSPDLCTGPYPDFLPDNCTATALGSTLVVRVQGLQQSGTSFSLDVRAISP